MIEAHAPAKINLTLRVLGRRPDGFHDIETLIVPLSLTDRLTIEAAPDWSFACDDPGLPVDERNLVVRAARLFFAETGVRPAARIQLAKSIPHGAGLAGGSSDAAAALRLLDQFFATNLPVEQLLAMAGQLGSDVPVFVAGHSAWCRGRGEILEPTQFPDRLPILLLKPPFGVLTPWAYKHWRDSRPLPNIPYDPQPFPWGVLENHLERAVFEKYLLLPAMKQWLLAQPETAGALMSGSGSTMFAILREAGLAPALAARARELFGKGLWTCETVAG
jgi:4-diphosphocytidyl-2-C-methyl-D-erythritol kinase